MGGREGERGEREVGIDGGREGGREGGTEGGKEGGRAGEHKYLVFLFSRKF